jgi:FKBP-type peptidyl-prolyl cis-trans isomerase
MRRIAAVLAVPILAVVALAGCGSSGSPSGGSASANQSVTVSGAFGKAPTVKIPAEKAGSNLVTKTEVQGTGQVLASADSFVANYVVYIWSGTKHKLALSTFTSTPQLLSGTLLPGLETALRGEKIGSRVLAVIPPKYGYGKSGNPQAGVTGTDTLVFVIDVIKSFAPTASAAGSTVSHGGGKLPTVTASGPGQEPAVTIPKTAPPPNLVKKTLIKGTGPAIAKGQEVVAQYVGVNWRTGKTFDASWAHTPPGPFGFRIGATPAQIIPGWDKGLLGVPVGSRVLLVIPPKDGYGKAGNSQAGIKGTDTLVFVVDVLGAFSQASSAS